MTHQKKPHVHAEIIKSKADDTSLVVFRKNEITGVWLEVVKNDDVFHKFSTYFLCLPNHKEACLHWLNGGEVQTDRGCGEFVDVYPLSDFDGKWYCDFWYMLDDYESRIKPKREKRWISYNPKTLEVYDCWKGHAPAEGFQVIEIEAEV